MTRLDPWGPPPWPQRSAAAVRSSPRDCLVKASRAVAVALCLAVVLLLTWGAMRVMSLPGYAGLGGYVSLEQRFDSNRAAFEEVVEDLSTPTQAARCAEAGPEGWVDVGVPARIGGYGIAHAACVPQGGFILYENSGAFFDDAGFAYLPDGPTQDLNTGWFEAPDFHPLGEGWYSFTASW